MDHFAVLREYKSLRRASEAVNLRLAESMGKDQVLAAARVLGLARGDTIVLRNQGEFGVLLEYSVHRRGPDGQNAVERMLAADPPPEGSDELRVLRSMRRARHGVFKVNEVIPGLGVCVREPRGLQDVLLVDVSLSDTADVGVVLAARIHSPADGWWMTTGATLPMAAASGDLLRAMAHEHRRRFGDELSEADQEVMIIRAGLAAIANLAPDDGEKEEADDGHAAAPMVRGFPRIGRNEPCPCGSGKKYKKCCGK